MASESDIDDPWNWSVDRVVQELCTTNRTWQPQSPAMSLISDPQSLEATLRDQEVTGSVLLREINMHVLKDDFGIKAIGRRSFIMTAIDQLRRLSPRFNSCIVDPPTSLITSELGRSLREVLSQIQRNNCADLLSISPQTSQRIQDNDQFLGVPSVVERRPFKSVNVFQRTAEQESDNPVTKNLSYGGPGRKSSSKISPSLSDNQNSEFEVEFQPNTSVSDKINVLPHHNLISEQSSVSHRKKNRRVVPTKVLSVINPILSEKRISSTNPLASAIQHMNTGTGLSFQDSGLDFTSKLGVVFKDSNGRKRIIPVTQSDSNFQRTDPRKITTNRDETESKSGEVLKQESRSFKNAVVKMSRQDVFLGKKKLDVDSLFYEDTSIGSEISDVNKKAEFFSGSIITTVGRRLYVHRRVKFFFLSQQQEIISEGKRCFVKIPYPKRLVHKFKEQSFTLYSPSIDDKVVARREVNIEVSSHNIQSLGNERLAIFNPLNRNLLEQIGTSGEWDYSSLEKYKFLEGGDLVLPPYGESDEDNEFDEATWKEIEAEYGEKKRPKQKLRKTPLSEKEVIQAIDTGIAHIVNTWKIRTASKRERKAWRLWCESRRLKNKHAQIMAAEIDLNHTQEYLTKIKKRIMIETWTSCLQIRKQLGSMEATIINQEELRWKISILKLKSPPQRLPPPTLKFKPKKNTSKSEIVDDIEGENISTCEDESSTYDDLDLDDFIDDNDDSDDNVASTEQLLELSFADSENDDIVTLDSSGMQEPKSLPTSLSQNKKRKKSLTQESLTKNCSLDKIHIKLPGKLKVSCKMEDGSSAINSKIQENINAKNQEIRSPILLKNELVDLTLSVSDDNESVQMCDNHASSESHRASFIDMTISSEDENSSKSEFESTILYSPPSKKKRVSENSNHISTPRHPNKFSKSDGTRSSDHDNNVLPCSNELPSLKDPEAIAKYSYNVLQQLNDRERLLTKFLYHLDATQRHEILQKIFQIPARRLWSEIKKKFNIQPKKTVNSIQSEDVRMEILVPIVSIFEMYVDCRFYTLKSKLEEKQLKKLRTNKFEDFNLFHNTCTYIAKLSKLYFTSSQGTVIKSSKVTENVNGDEDINKYAKVNDKKSQSKTLGSSEGELTASEKRPLKRKKNIYENKEARDMREQDLRRLAQQNERRKKLHAALVEANDDQAIVRSQLIINDAATEDQKFIYVNGHIAKRIKKHQVEGVRFLWNQIVTTTDEQSMQGCLLAHTMGLGKTMQTITLLVAIAEASRSKDPSVSSQIPESLRQSRTLILCPPSLVNNWMDELLVWVPDNILGELRKADSSIKSLPQRRQTILDWYEDGGVLVIGYEMFRDLVNFKGKNTSDTEHELVSKNLLEGPNIIIADEAHKMKNRKAAITIAASKFRSKSRIALTGSPLANNVEEYHTMIEWVAPNYLGPIVEFRAKYVEPIQAGNYQNSTAYERRRSLKMLGVLSADLAPKVHRADMSVMKNDLPAKKEFVITVPLTDVQKKAYSIFVKSMMGGNSYTTTKLDEVTPTTVWHWLAVLSLLCNHPECFRQKLLKRKDEARNETANPIDLDESDNESAVDLNTPLWKAGVSQELIDAENKIFEETKSLDSIHMSNKVLHLCQILDACKSIGDKALVFSQSISTLDFLEVVFKKKNRNYARLDGSTAISRRQGQTKQFNNGDTDIYLISTTAGGLGLNLQGANRVIIFDFKFNPIMEEQAVGRAYRIGQKKPTFVYRFIVGGTFEDSVFKTQLASRVVDKKNPIAWANKKASEFLFEPKEVPQKDLSEFEGMDPCVLDRLLQSQKRRDQRGVSRTISSIVQTDTFAVDDDDKLTPDEEKEVQSELEKTRLFRANPHAFHLQQIAEQQYYQQLQQNMLSYQENTLNSSGSEQNIAVKRIGSDINLVVPVSNLTSSVEAQGAFNRAGPANNSSPGLTTSPSFIRKNGVGIPKSNTLKPRSPVAGANTKVAILQSEIFNPNYNHQSNSLQTEKSLISVNAVKTGLLGHSNSTEIQTDHVDGEVLIKDSPNAPQNINDEQQKPKEFEDKHLKKVSKEWDMTKRYRESRGSNLHDYGPIKTSIPSKPSLEQNESQVSWNRIVNKKQLGKPLDSNQNNLQDTLNKNVKISCGFDEMRPIPRKDVRKISNGFHEQNNIDNTRKPNPAEVDLRFHQKSFNPPTSPSRQGSPPYRGSSQKSYRRFSPPPYRRSSPPPYRRRSPSYYTSSGSGNFNYRKIPSWQDYDERTRSYRGQSYRPSNRYAPYH